MWKTCLKIRGNHASLWKIKKNKTHQKHQKRIFHKILDKFCGKICGENHGFSTVFDPVNVSSMKPWKDKRKFSEILSCVTVGAHSQFGCMVAHFFAVVCGRFMNRPYGKHPYENQPKADVLFFSYIRLAASSMHKCVICPSDVVCASRVGSYKANIISL